MCLLFGGISVLAQGAQATTQFDLWNWYSVKAPALAQGIVVEPSDDATWYMASANGLYITRDGGATWTRSLPDPVSKEGIFADGTGLYVGTGASIYFSGDHGGTWVAKGGFSNPIASVFVSPTDASVWVGLRGASGSAALYRAPRGFTSWAPVPFGPLLSGIVNVWDMVEDGNGWLWAATEPATVAAGKMLIASADRGATWVDATGGLTASPTKLVWDGAGGALYAATPSGLLATGNQGARWVYYLRTATLTVAITPVMTAVSATPGILAGMDAGGGVEYTGTMLHSDLIDPHVTPYGMGTAIGLAGVSFQALALNHTGTRFVAVSKDGGVYGGTALQPQLNPSTVTVPPGGSLSITCATCPFGPGMQIFLSGQQQLAPSMGGPAVPYTYGPYQFNVPASMPPGTYPAKLTTTFPPISFTLVVGPVSVSVPTITKMTSVTFGVKPQYGAGEVVSLFGTGLTGTTGISAANSSPTVPLATQLALSQVMVDTTPAPLYYAATGNDGSSQINFQIPYTMAPGPHKVHVIRLQANGRVDATTADFPFLVAAVSPTYIADASGNAYVQDVTQDPTGHVFASAATPAHPNDVAVIYATGLGATSPAVVEGAVPTPGALANVTAPVSVSLWDGIVTQWKATVLGAVASPQYPGLYQIAVRLPADAALAGGLIKLIVAVGSDTQTFNINFSR